MFYFMLDYIKQLLFKEYKHMMDMVQDDINKRVLNVIYEIKRDIFKEIMVLFMFFISIVLLAIGGVFFFIEYVNLDKTISFLIIGVFVLFLALIFKLLK